MQLRRIKTVSTGIAVVLAAALLSGCVINGKVVPTDAASAPSPAQLREKIGVAAGSSLIWEQDDALRNRSLKAIADTGARWVTMDLDWNGINGASPTTWRWSHIDRFVTESRSYGLKIIAVAAYSPPWAVPASCPRGDTHCLPASPEPFATFVKASAQRYGSRSAIPELRNTITTWQIWNEPNHVPFVQPFVDVAGYTTLLKRAYVEIKAADPSALVITGATAPAPDDPSGRDMAPVTFLKGIYAHGGKGYFDAVGHHPYSFPCSPLVSEQWNAFQQTKTLHDVMAQNGDGAKKVWGTESGAPTATNVGPCAAGPNVSVTEAQQAQYVADYFKGWTEKFGNITGVLVWYQIRDNGTNRAYYDDNLGLLRRDFSPKPAYGKFQQLLAG